MFSSFKIRTAATIMVCGVGLAGCAFFADPVGEMAPPFQATIDAKGETYSLLDITHSKPVVVLFTKVETAEGKRAIKFTAELMKAFGDTVQVLVIAPIAPLEIVKWQDEFPTEAPILPDPDRKIGKAYKVKGTPSLVMVGHRGRLLAHYDGISPDIIADLEKRIAAETKLRSWKAPSKTVQNVPTFNLNQDYFIGRTPTAPVTKIMVD